MEMNINGVVTIKGDEKNRGKWKIEIIKNTFICEDNTIGIRSIRNVPGRVLLKDYLSWCIQQSYTVPPPAITSNIQDEKSLNVIAE